MHSVLIVDDEEPVLDSYALMVETSVGFALAGKARSGYEALVLMDRLRPDVVFMDIGLPGMDGLATIEEVHDRLPHTVFVVSTAYERFDLARRAIPLGIFRYLVKPVTKRDFVETLEAVRTQLTRRPPGVVPDQFLKVDLWGPLTEERWQTVREALGLESAHGRVVFVGADVDQDRLFGNLSVQLAFRHVHFFTIHRGLGMFFVPGDVADGVLEAEFGRLLGTLVPPDAVTFVGVGSCRRGPDLPVSCQEALARVNALRDHTDFRARERVRLAQIRRQVGLAPWNEVSASFQAYWREAFATCEFSVAKAKMVALFTLLLDASGGGEAGLLDLSPAEDIAPLTDVAAWARWAEPALERVHRWASQQRAGGLPPPLAKALAFLEDQYHRSIQLSDAAEAACVSPAYLSRLFGDHLGSTFVGYLTMLRMEKAEKLIRDHRLNIKEVSFRVGYQDPNYFSKIFHKVVGTSPSLYARGGRHES